MGDSSEYYYILEREVRKAIANSVSNRGAAKYLGISVQTYRKAAKQYIDKETGLDLYTLHLNEAGKGVVKKRHGYTMEDCLKILDGNNVVQLSRKKFKQALISNLIYEEKCQECGYCERRIDNFEVPLIFIFEDGNKYNFKKDNIKLVCPNCYSIRGGKIVASEIRGKKPKLNRPEVMDYID